MSARKLYGTLFLLPIPLFKEQLPKRVLPISVIERAQSLTYFVAENAKTARAFLKTLPHPMPLQEIKLSELNGHTPEQTLPSLLAPLLEGKNVGLVSEAGCPAVADPGARLVELAHQKGICVRPEIGPSSLLLALMASGLSGQNFAFHGYLPIKAEKRREVILRLEKRSKEECSTHFFIETPYRNLALFETFRTVLAKNTRLCLAINMSTTHEYVATHRIETWRKMPVPELEKQPTVFLIQA